ncbi:MAG: hypothetical protein CMN78_00325 [Spirochaetales bacterium]|nr:hypothetical protein [Spirochaetales bacterium]
MNVQEELLRREIDPELTSENLSALASSALGRKTQVGQYRVLTGGCWNRVISVDAGSEKVELVFKISPKVGDESLSREFNVLKSFSAYSEMPVPEPLLSDTAGEIIPGSVLVMRRIHGQVMHEIAGSFTTGERQRINDEIAEYVTALHENHDTGFGGIEVGQDGRNCHWRDFWLPRFDKVLAEVSQGDFVSEKMLDQIHEIRSSIPGMIDIGAVSTMTHYDIWSGNVMIAFRNDIPYVSGFIDIPGFFADYAREISFMYMFGMADQRFFNRYTATHDLDDGFALRLHIYNLKMHLKHISMYPNEYYYRRGAQECLRFIQKSA